MLIHDCLEKVVRPALAQLELGGISAEVMLLATGQQESDLIFTRQLDGGPARGYWGAEIEGVADVFVHSHSKERALVFCKLQGVEPTAEAVYEALETNPILAAGVFRLKLAANPTPLTLVASDMWLLYMDVQRPGKPRPETWGGYFDKALNAVTGGSL